MTLKHSVSQIDIHQAAQNALHACALGHEVNQEKALGLISASFGLSSYSEAGKATNSVLPYDHNGVEYNLYELVKLAMPTDQYGRQVLQVVYPAQSVCGNVKACTLEFMLVQMIAVCNWAFMDGKETSVCFKADFHSSLYNRNLEAYASDDTSSDGIVDKSLVAIARDKNIGGQEYAWLKVEIFADFLISNLVVPLALKKLGINEEIYGFISAEEAIEGDKIKDSYQDINYMRGSYEKGICYISKTFEKV